MNIVPAIKALADETRLRLVALLHGRELNVGEIVRVLGMSQPRISRHLKILAGAGLLKARRDGLWMFYSVPDNDSVDPFVQSLLPFILQNSTFIKDRHSVETIISSRREEARIFFDSIAKKWRALRREVLQDFDDVALFLKRIPGGGVVADLGCGPGDLLAALEGKAHLSIGVDNSSKMLELASRRFLDTSQISLRIGDLQHLPLKDREADIAILSLVLHHLEDPRKALAEAARVLKPTGKLLVLDFLSHDDESLRRRLNDRWLGFDSNLLERWLLESGFAIRERLTLPVNNEKNLIFFEVVKPKENKHGHTLESQTEQ